MIYANPPDRTPTLNNTNIFEMTKVYTSVILKVMERRSLSEILLNMAFNIEKIIFKMVKGSKNSGFSNL